MGQPWPWLSEGGPAAVWKLGCCRGPHAHAPPQQGQPERWQSGAGPWDSIPTASLSLSRRAAFPDEGPLGLPGTAQAPPRLPACLLAVGQAPSGPCPAWQRVGRRSPGPWGRRGGLPSRVPSAFFPALRGGGGPSASPFLVQPSTVESLPSPDSSSQAPPTHPSSTTTGSAPGCQATAGGGSLGNLPLHGNIVLPCGPLPRRPVQGAPTPPGRPLTWARFPGRAAAASLHRPASSLWRPCRRSVWFSWRLTWLRRCRRLSLRALLSRLRLALTVWARGAEEEGAGEGGPGGWGRSPRPGPACGTGSPETGTAQDLAQALPGTLHGTLHGTPPPQRRKQCPPRNRVTSQGTQAPLPARRPPASPAGGGGSSTSRPASQQPPSPH